MTSAAGASVPPLPSWSPSEFEAQRDAAATVAARLAAARPAPRALFVFAQRRLLREALASVSPVRVAGDDELWPARRRFLTAEHVRRLDAAERGLGYVEGRVRRRLDGGAASVLDDESSYVLNALGQGVGESPVRTNAGLLRQTAVGFDPSESSWAPPPAEICGQLLADAVAATRFAPVDAWVRAVWLAITVLSVHPFVDGNGRTARLLYQLVSSEAGAHDYWSIERWAADRAAYIDSIKAVQVGAGYGSGDLDVTPFLTFASKCSIDGARRSERRLLDLSERCAAATGDDVDTMVEMAVRIDRNSHVDELCELPISRAEVVAALRRAEASGRLRFDHTFGWNAVGDDPLRTS